MKRIRDILEKEVPEHIWEWNGVKATCKMCELTAEYHIDIEMWIYSTNPRARNCRAKLMDEALD